MKKTTILGLCIIALLGFSAWASNAFAYGSSGDCLGCHSGFVGPGETLHDAHNEYINECTACHQSVGDTPDINSSGNTLGFGCTGCHEPMGLWRHHTNSGTSTCSGCHGNPTPPPESNVPPYYGTSVTSIEEPCVSSPSPPGEDSNGDGFGLDNDGDLAYDEDDPDCQAPPNDYNADGISDVLLRNQLDGSWQMNLMDTTGNGMVAQTFETNLNKNSNVVLAGIGDFNGDGFDDVLTRNSIWGIWQVNLMDASGSGMVAQTFEVNLNKNLVVQLAGIGDFNGDGFDDVLTRNSTWGLWQVNLMDSSGNGMVAQTFETNLNKNLVVQLAGIGDFNGDGFDDVLTRNSTWGIWQVNLMDASGNGMVAQTFETNLNKNLVVQLAGIGDFNGDGFDDVLTRNSTWGLWQVNLMDSSGSGMVAQTFEVNLNKNLVVEMNRTGDFNGDGFDDVLTRNSIWGIWQVNLMDSSGSGMVAQTFETNLIKDLNWQ